jgi:hypothetical protein
VTATVIVCSVDGVTAGCVMTQVALHLPVDSQVIVVGW